QAVKNAGQHYGRRPAVSADLFSWNAVSVYVQHSGIHVQRIGRVEDPPVSFDLFVDLKCFSGSFYDLYSSYGSGRGSDRHGSRPGDLCSYVFCGPQKKTEGIRDEKRLRKAV